MILSLWYSCKGAAASQTWLLSFQPFWRWRILIMNVLNYYTYIISQWNFWWIKFSVVSSPTGLMKQPETCSKKAITVIKTIVSSSTLKHLNNPVINPGINHFTRGFAWWVHKHGSLKSTWRQHFSSSCWPQGSTYCRNKDVLHWFYWSAIIIL